MRALLERGDEVTGFSRGVSKKPTAGLERVIWKTWDPDQDGAWQDALDGQGGIVHLTGEPAVGKRFTDSVKREILGSRVHSTQRIVRAIEKARVKPGVLVHASGVGFYGVKAGDAIRFDFVITRDGDYQTTKVEAVGRSAKAPEPQAGHGAHK